MFRSFIFLFFFFSCNVIEEDNLRLIQFKDEYSIYVREGRVLKKAYVLDENYAISKSSELIFNNNIPNWLSAKIKAKNINVPTIGDIDAPFEFIKKEKANYFTVIKNNDTLAFFLSESIDWEFEDL